MEAESLVAGERLISVFLTIGITGEGINDVIMVQCAEKDFSLNVEVMNSDNKCPSLSLYIQHCRD